jgi:hypothetical protein
MARKVEMSSQYTNAHARRDPTRSALFQLGGGAFGERERHDGRRLCALGDERRDTAGHRLCFAGSRASDHLEVGAAVVDDLLLGDRKAE